MSGEELLKITERISSAVTTCGAGVSDHFGAWMALGGAGIALIATLAGVVVTSILENRRDVLRRAHADQIEETKRQHEAAVRFHDERLSAYIDYIGVITRLFSTASVWVESGAKGSFEDYEGFRNAVSPYPTSMTRVSILAKPELNAKVREVHTWVQKLVTEHLAPDAVWQVINDSTVARAAFETAAKKELGIS